MVSVINQRHFAASVRFAAVCAFALTLVSFISHSAMADFAAVGDISGTVNEGGGPTGDLIIGDTGTGGLLGDAVQPLVGTLAALESDNVIIGHQENSIGAVNIEDFIPGSQGNWEISDDLVVGHAGLGFLDLLNAAGVGNSPATSVGGTIWVGGGTTSTAPIVPVSGEGALGEGIIRVNGLGTRLQGQSDLVVGGEGIGLIEASGRASINIIGASEIGSTGITGDGTVRLTDLGTRWTAGAAVTVGGLAGESYGKVQIFDEAVFQVEDVATGSTGALTINPRGTIELDGGTLRMVDQIANRITNDGVIRGSGFIDGGIDIGTSGELRNAAGVANAREYLVVSEEVENDGLIESIGGEMEFSQMVTNNAGGDIVARDAIMRFRGIDAGGAADDLVNDGDLILLGDSTIYGSISGGGVITTNSGTPGDSVTIVGDVTFDPSPLAASMSGDLTVPSTGFALTVHDASALTIDGDLSLAGMAALAIDYVGEDPIEEGDVLPVLSVTGSITGDFSNSELAANGRMWGIDVVGDEVMVTAGALLTGLEGDFDADGDVDGSDFLAWQRTDGTPGGLADWQSNYAGGSPLVASATVPEPTTLALVLMTLACCPRRRVRR